MMLAGLFLVSGSVYFQDQIKIFKNFTANLGLRYDQYSLVTTGHGLSPRLNLLV